MSPEEIAAAGEQLKANLAANSAATVVPAGVANDQILAANTQLVNQTNQAATRLGNEVELRQNMLAEGLSTGSNAPGGYMYQRNIAPVVGALTAGLTANAQQNVLKGAIRDNTFAAQKAYEDAQFAYRERQRAYQAQQAERNRQRRIAAERAQAAAYLAASGGSKNTGRVGGVIANAKPQTQLGASQGGAASVVQNQNYNPQRPNVNVKNTVSAALNNSGTKGISLGTQLLKGVKF